MAYAAAAFAFTQGLDVVVQRFGWPDRVEKLIILVLAVGFFVALVLAWYHGERGAQKVGDTELVIIALLLALGGGALWMYARSTPTTAARAALVAASEPAVIRSGASMTAVTVVPPPASAIPAKSVAVLSFANESGDKDQQFFRWPFGRSDQRTVAVRGPEGHQPQFGVPVPRQQGQRRRNRQGAGRRAPAGKLGAARR